MNKQTYTITLGDVAENHVGMQKIGQPSQGLTITDLENARLWFENKGYQCEMIDLNFYLPDQTMNDDASVLIIKNGLFGLTYPNTPDDFWYEQFGLEKDKKAKMYGRVVNKKARYNLCFSHESQEPNYELGIGRVVAFRDVPILKRVMTNIQSVIPYKCNDLVAEGNYYYDITKCGIGFHGDAERRKVIGIRVGCPLPLHYQWFYQNKPVGQRCRIILGHGDIYFMSEKATGHDWKRKSILTLRHAAGCSKFLK